MKARIQFRLKRSRRYAFTRNDLIGFVGYDQTGRAEHELVKGGKFLKVGYGICAIQGANQI